MPEAYVKYQEPLAEPYQTPIKKKSISPISEFLQEKVKFHIVL